MSSNKHRQIVQLGGISAIKMGMPARISDLYYWVMEMRWLTFVGLVTSCFLAINLVFGTLYALLPGAVANAEPGSLLDGIFFSIDTLGTVGYGFMYPANHLAHLIAATEILIGLFFSATMTGLIFARFARPRMSLVFAKTAVIARYEGRRALMVRVASMRSRPMANAAAQLSWLETVNLSDGRTFRRVSELALVTDRNPLFGLAWTVVHLIEDDSPFLAAFHGDDRFILSLTISGTDSLLAAQAMGTARYRREDIRVDHDYVDVISERDGIIYLDLELLHDTRPLG